MSDGIGDRAKEMLVAPGYGLRVGCSRRFVQIEYEGQMIELPLFVAEELAQALVAQLGMTVEQFRK